jgi:isopenicillin N synthase-like dioxygenase
LSNRNTTRIPVADFSAMRANDTDSAAAQSFLETWDHAFRNFGFITLINHGLEQRYQQLHPLLEEFFDLPEEEKLKFRIAAEYGHGGYIPQGQESVSRTHLDKAQARPPDAVESLATSNSNLGTFPNTANGYPTDDLLTRCMALKEGLDDLAIKVMQVMARCLALPPDHFLPYYQDGRANNDLRVANYLPVTQSQGGQQMRYGEHTDYTGFTFLWRSADNGLQCQHPDIRVNDWIDIPILAEHQDALIVNAGDLIQRWTNDYWVSNVHRVSGQTNDVDEADRRNPMSIVYFTGPHEETKIGVLTESDKVLQQGPVKAHYAEEITAGEHLWRKINASNQ